MAAWQEWAPYVSAQTKRQRAERFLKEAEEREQLSPVRLVGQAIASSFWGRAWCNNLEAYSDFANRLPRGRTYLRAGAVVDLRITADGIVARVQGANLYTVRIRIRPLDAARWQELVRCCTSAGTGARGLGGAWGRGGARGLGSIVELLQGRMEREIVAALTAPRRGLLPAPHEIEMSCSCPDWAVLCKHIAATLYGVGARLDTSPELLFALRQVAMEDLVLRSAASLSVPEVDPGEVLSGDPGQLGALFGIDLGTTAEPVPPPPPEADGAPSPAAQPRVELPSAPSARSPSARQADQAPGTQPLPSRRAEAQGAQADARKLAALRALLSRLEGPRSAAARSRHRGG